MDRQLRNTGLLSGTTPSFPFKKLRKCLERSQLGKAGPLLGVEVFTSLCEPDGLALTVHVVLTVVVHIYGNKQIRNEMFISKSTVYLFSTDYMRK
jgi:hypothetical protein